MNLIYIWIHWKLLLSSSHLYLAHTRSCLIQFPAFQVAPFLSKGEQLQTQANWITFLSKPNMQYHMREQIIKQVSFVWNKIVPVVMGYAHRQINVHIEPQSLSQTPWFKLLGFCFLRTSRLWGGVYAWHINYFDNWPFILWSNDLNQQKWNGSHNLNVFHSWIWINSKVRLA